jgi:hypothetical protein
MDYREKVTTLAQWVLNTFPREELAEQFPEIADLQTDEGLDHLATYVNEQCGNIEGNFISFIKE